MSLVHLKVQDGLAEIILDRPKVNALNLELFGELRQAMDTVNKDTSIRGVLIRSAGTCFSAGLDLLEVVNQGPDGIERFLKALDDSVDTSFRSSKPMAAAVAGHAIAGGLVLALSADFLALGQGRYKLGLTELKVGIPFPRVPFEIVRNSIGPRALRRLVYTADLIGPEEAFSLGIGDVLTDDPVEAARQWLQSVCSRPAGAFAVAKRQIREDAWRRIDNADKSEREELINIILSEEVAEAAMKVISGRG